MESEKKIEKVPKRCQFETCRHKLGLVSFACRCGQYFCGEHRIAECHKCTFNYKEDHKKELLKYMSSPIVAAKIEVL